MKIAVNTRLLIKNKLEGIGWFTFQTLKRITIAHPEHEFIFIFDRDYDPSFIFSDNITPVVIRPPARHPFLWIIWFEWSVRRVLKKCRADIFLSPDGFLCLTAGTPSIAVIHDINFHHRPEEIPLLTRLYYNFFFPRFARKAVRLATVSEFSRNDIIKSYHIPENKISRISNGAHELYSPVPDRLKSMIKARYTGGAPFLIYVGSLHPRKNIVNLLKSFDLYKRKANEVKLMIVGERMFKTGGMRRTYHRMQHKADVIFAGRLEPEELHLVLGSAIALVYIPFFEGFGIPLVEAMHCEIPILASNTTAIPEVAGDAAIYTRPDDINEIAEKMELIVNDNTLRERLVNAGKKRKELYSWDKSAEMLWDLISVCP